MVVIAVLCSFYQFAVVVVDQIDHRNVLIVYRPLFQLFQVQALVWVYAFLLWVVFAYVSVCYLLAAVSYNQMAVMKSHDCYTSKIPYRLFAFLARWKDEQQP